MTVEFYHGALAESYEEQANNQGFTLGKESEFVQQIGFGLVAAYIHGIITDGEFDKIIQRFQKKMIVKNLKKIEAKK